MKLSSLMVIRVIVMKGLYVLLISLDNSSVFVFDDALEQDIKT